MGIRLACAASLFRSIPGALRDFGDRHFGEKCRCTAVFVKIRRDALTGQAGDRSTCCRLPAARRAYLIEQVLN